MRQVAALAKSKVGVVVLVALLVGAGVGTHLALSPSDPSPLDSVPDEVDYVGHLNATAMREDPAVANATRHAFRFQSRLVFYPGPPFLRSLAFAEARPDGRVRSVTYFGRANGSEYGARIVRADWRPSRVVAAVEARRNVSLDREAYRETPLFVGEGVAVATLSESRFVVGNATAVRDAVDVARGEADPVDGDLRRAYERQRRGYARFAFRFDPTDVPDLPFVGGAVSEVRAVSTAYYRNGSRMGVRTNVSVASESAAEDVEAMLVLGTNFYARVLPDESAEAYRREMATAEFAADGRTVVVRYESTPEGFEQLLAALERR